MAESRALAGARESGLLAPGRSVVVLLSGGQDSTCLLDVAVALCGREVVSALHVNYGLRADSDAEAAACGSLCERLEVPLAVERAARPQGATGNLQAWARDVRYSAGSRAALAAGADLAAGHTATDQAETVLYRLVSSPGRRALLGMPGRSGRLVRPLLGVTREDTAEHCRARGLPWSRDPSNTSDAFARSRIRGGLMPELEAVDARAVANIVHTAELLRDEAEVLDVVVDTALAGRDRLSVEHLRELPPALARLVVRRLAEDATGRLCARAAARFDDILALGDGALDVGDGARAVVERGVLRFALTP